MTRQMARRTGGAALLALTLLLGEAAPSGAVDLGGVFTIPPEGFLCADGAPPDLPSVWLGHFQGGNASYDPAIGQTALAFTDVKLCFPSQRSCGRWLRSLRATMHRPIGYYTCLPLR